MGVSWWSEKALLYLPLKLQVDQLECHKNMRSIHTLVHLKVSILEWVGEVWYGMATMEATNAIQFNTRHDPSWHGSNGGVIL